MQKRVLEVLKTWYFPYSAFWSAGQWGGGYSPPPPPWLNYWLYVCTKVRGNRSRDFGFRIRKPPRKFGVKSGFNQKRLKYGKKYFIGLYVSRYPFIPTNPLLAAMRFISCFSFFFSFFSFFFSFFFPFFSS